LLNTPPSIAEESRAGQGRDRDLVNRRARAEAGTSGRFQGRENAEIP